MVTVGRVWRTQVPDSLVRLAGVEPATLGLEVHHRARRPPIKTNNSRENRADIRERFGARWGPSAPVPVQFTHKRQSVPALTRSGLTLTARPTHVRNAATAPGVTQARTPP